MSVAIAALFVSGHIGTSAAQGASSTTDDELYTEQVADPFGAEVQPGNVEFDSASITVGIDPAEVAWLALSSSPELVDAATGRDGDEPPDGILDLLPVAVNDHVVVTVTNLDTSESEQTVLDANNSGGGATSNQAVLYGRHPSVVSIVQIDFSTDPVTYFTVAEPELGLLDEFFTTNGPGDYRFDLSFRNEYSTEAGHQEIWLVGQGSGIGAPGSAGPSPLIFVFGGAAAVAAAAVALAARARRRRGPGGSSKPNGEQQRDQVIIQVSAERLDVTTSRHATLMMTGWVLQPPGAPHRADVALTVEAPSGSGLTVSPSSGLGELEVDVGLDALPEDDEAILTVAGAYGTARGQAHVLVEMKVDYELQLF